MTRTAELNPIGFALDKTLSEEIHSRHLMPLSRSKALQHCSLAHSRSSPLALAC